MVTLACLVVQALRLLPHPLQLCGARRGLLLAGSRRVLRQQCVVDLDARLTWLDTSHHTLCWCARRALARRHAAGGLGCHCSLRARSLLRGLVLGLCHGAAQLSKHFLQFALKFLHCLDGALARKDRLQALRPRLPRDGCRRGPALPHCGGSRSDRRANCAIPASTETDCT